jgi:hypothetical protein
VLNVIILSVDVLNVDMLNVIMLNVNMLSVVMLNVIVLNVIMLNVVAPTFFKFVTAVHFRFRRTFSKSSFQLTMTQFGFISTSVSDSAPISVSDVFPDFQPRQSTSTSASTSAATSGFSSTRCRRYKTFYGRNFANYGRS